MKLIQLLKENEEPQKLSPEVKKHFLEIVSTYNKYQEMMDRKSDLTEIAETLGGITEAAKTLLLGESDDWFDKVTIKRNMSELEKLGTQFDKVAKEANSLDQRMHGLYEDMGHILSRYYKMGEISEDQMKQRLGMRESKQDCGCNSIKESAEDVNKAMLPSDVKIKLQKAMDVLNGKKLTHPQKLQVLGRVLDSLGMDKKELNKATTKLRTKLEIKEDGTLQGGEKDPCWKGYEMVGMKKKNGKEVPNCVPKN
jgi:energy-converting hydrogenase A subunit M